MSGMKDDSAQAHLPRPDTQVDLSDDYDVTLWALVMGIEAQTLQEAAYRVGSNVWSIWREVQGDPGRYPRGDGRPR